MRFFKLFSNNLKKKSMLKKLILHFFYINIGSCGYGCLCRNHFDEDMKRSHLDPNVIFLCYSFMAMDLEKLPSINLSDDMKKKIRVFVDALYDHYIGVQIKAKKFIDGLDGWADIMR